MCIIFHKSQRLGRYGRYCRNNLEIFASLGIFFSDIFKTDFLRKSTIFLQSWTLFFTWLFYDWLWSDPWWRCAQCMSFRQILGQRFLIELKVIFQHPQNRPKTPFGDNFYFSRSRKATDILKDAFDAKSDEEFEAFLKNFSASTLTAILRAKAGNLNFWTPDLDKYWFVAPKQKIGHGSPHMPHV